jgi:hypothetical protein
MTADRYGSKSDAVSFERDIKPFFTDTDRDHMLNQVGLFDLHLASDVCANYDDIRDAITKKRMPIPKPWDDATIAKFVALFDPWKQGGCQP